MTTTPLVSATGLAKSYPMPGQTVEALRGVDLQVRAGELVSIMGTSGSGKSTLMHVLGCLERPTRGRYLLGGQDVTHLTDDHLSQIRARRIGFVFQSFNLVPELDVLDNVLLPFMYAPMPERDAHARAAEALNRVGLWKRRRHLPSELSGGERQRAAIARALVVQPLLILADEPTGNLDSKTSGLILNLFLDLHARGATILLVTHDPAVAQRCPRLLRMADGLLVGEEVAG